MRKFLTKIIFISLPLIIAAVLMEVLLRNIPNDYLLKKEYLDKHSSEIETLILGSSHTFYGLNPVYFSKNTFNESHISQTLDYDFKLLQKYESGFDNLKTIVLPISYFSLFEKLESTTESWRVKNYIIYYEINKPNDLIHHTEILSNRLDINLKRLKAYYISDRTMITCNELGWGKDYNSQYAMDLAESGKTSAIRNTSKDLYSDQQQTILKENKRILKDIIEWSRQRKITLILLTTPVFETYSRDLDKTQLYITIETATNLDLENDNCIYLNWLNDTSFYGEDFYDADHLSEIGAEKLSHSIDDVINDLE